MADTRYQEGSLKQFKTKQGLVWKLRYFAYRDPDGKWTEQTPLLVGAVSDFSTEKRARAEAVRLGLIEQINRTSVPVNKVTFGFIARDYARIDLAEDAIKPKASTTRYTENLIINKHLLPRWEGVLVSEMKTLAIEKWLKSVSVDTLGEKGQEWDSLTKWRRVMNDIFLHGHKHDLIPESCNPMLKVDVKASSSGYVPIILTPNETYVMLNALPLLQQTMTVLDAATGIDEAALRELREETGVIDVYLEQLYSFGDPKRDPRGRIISISYFALISSDHQLKAGKVIRNGIFIIFPRLEKKGPGSDESCYSCAYCLPFRNQHCSPPIFVLAAPKQTRLKGCPYVLKPSRHR